MHTKHSQGYITSSVHKSSIGKFKKIEIISNIFSDHNAMRLDINYKKKKVEVVASLVAQRLKHLPAMQET